MMARAVRRKGTQALLLAVLGFVGLLIGYGVLAAEVPDDLEFANGLFRRGFYKEAAELYKTFLESNPPVEQANAALERLAESAYAAKQYDDALSAFEKLLQADTAGPASRRALLRKGEILYRLKRNEEALAVLNPLTAEGVEAEVRAGALYYVGKIHYEGNNSDAALKAFKLLAEALPKSPLAPYARYQLAFVYLAKEQPENAVVEFSAVAASGADDKLRAESRFRAAETYDKLAWYDAAAKAYQQLQTDFPNSDYAERAAYGNAWTLYNARRFADAAKAAKAYVEGNPNSARVTGMKYLQANCLQEEKDYDAALTQYRKIRDESADGQQPDSVSFTARAHYKIAWVLFLQGKPADAKTEVASFLEKYSGSSLVGDAAFLQGTLLASEGNYKDAYDEFTLVAQKYPDSEFAAEALYKSGECLAQLDRAKEAVPIFEAFAQKYPHHPLTEQAILRVGDSQFFAAAFKEAVAKYRQLLDSAKDPSAVQDILYRLAVTYHNMDDFKSSAETFATILEKIPEGPHTAEAHLRIGDYHLREGKDIVKSISEFEAAYKADPKGSFAGRAVKGLALARYKTNDLDGAAQAFLRTMEEFPDISLNEKTYAWVGQRLFDQQKYDQAALALTALLRAVPNYPAPERIKFMIAECSEKAGKTDAAIEQYKAVSEAAPHSVSATDAKYRIAKLFEAKNDADKAMALYEEAANANTGETATRARFRIAELYEAKGDFETAAKNFMRVAILLLHEELSPESLWRAGQCFEKAGGIDQAKKAYQELVTDYPNKEQAVKAKERLTALS